MQEVQDLFKQLDADHSGGLSLKEFQVGLGAAGADRVLARTAAGFLNPRKVSGASRDSRNSLSNGTGLPRKTDDKLEAFFRHGHFTENVDALFEAGITLDMLIEYRCWPLGSLRPAMCIACYGTAHRHRCCVCPTNPKHP